MVFILSFMLSTCFRLIIVRAGLRIRLGGRGCLAGRVIGLEEDGVVHARPGRLDRHGLLLEVVLERDGRRRGGAGGSLEVGQHVEMRHDMLRVGAVDVHLVDKLGERQVQVRAR